MSNEVVKKDNGAYVARYNEPGTNNYAAFANEADSMLVGQLLTCKKGVWGIGRDEDPVPAGARYLVQVPTMMRGMVKWVGGAIVDHRMGLVKDGFIVPHRYSLGDLDEAAWEKDHQGEPRDPWVTSYLVVLTELSPPHGDYTFSGGSYGAKIFAQELCKIYSEQGPADPDVFPVVELTVKHRQTKSFGKIAGPWCDVVGWASLEDVKAGRKEPAAKATLTPAAPAAAKAAAAPAEGADFPGWESAAS